MADKPNKYLDAHKTNSQLTYKRLCEVIDYDDKTSKLYWKKNSSNPKMRRSGLQAGTIVNGYLQISIDDIKYKAHRLVWLFVHGEWPTGDIDHINGDRLDNSISNLRVATLSQNGKNKSFFKNNTSGYKGVSFCKSRNSFEAKIKSDGKSIFLGRYISAEKAHEAYQKASNRLHGEYARKLT